MLWSPYTFLPLALVVSLIVIATIRQRNQARRAVADRTRFDTLIEAARERSLPVHDVVSGFPGRSIWLYEVCDAMPAPIANQGRGHRPPPESFVAECIHGMHEHGVPAAIVDVDEVRGWMPSILAGRARIILFSFGGETEEQLLISLVLANDWLPEREQLEELHDMLERKKMGAAVAERPQVFTERRRRANDQEFLDLRRRFESREAAWQRITHDLRQPLNNLSITHQRLRHCLGQLSAEDEMMATIREGIDRMGRQLGMLEHLTHDVLHIGTGQAISGESQDFDLSEEVRGILDLHRDGLRTRRIELDASIEEGIATRLQRSGVYRILFNLLGNAVKFCSSPGHIWVELRRRYGMPVLSVEDSGIGLHSQEAIFDLSRENIGRAGSGWGIGLASARALAEELGGRLIAAKPRERNGARFLLVLPRR